VLSGSSWELINPVDPTPNWMAQAWQETLGWQPTAAQNRQFELLYELILAGNRQLNLTRITDVQEFGEKHLWDSLRGVAQLLSVPALLKVIDIGTGGGFPGLPVAIARPDWQVTLLDSTRKKMTFLQTLLTPLGLDQVRTLCDRAESVGQHPDHREQYDLALIRAVGPAAVCAEYALPLVKVGGLAVLYRGQWQLVDTEALRPAVRQLGGQIETLEAFKTPLSHSDRHCLYLRKLTPTPPQLPRPVGVPAQNPL